MDNELQEAIDNVATYNNANPHIWGLGQVVKAARKVANPTDEDLERLYPPLLNFRKWVRKTNALTDHDLLVTARRMITALENK